MAVPDPANGWEILNAVAQTFGALGTAGALWVAAVAYRRQVKDRHLAQASGVTVFVLFGAGVPIEVVVGNYSDRPVSSVRVLAHTLEKESDTFEPDGPGALRPLAPGTETVIRLRGPYTEQVSVGFVDAAGRNWIRTGEGDLSEGSLPRTTAQAEREKFSRELLDMLQARIRERDAQEARHGSQTDR